MTEIADRKETRGALKKWRHNANDLQVRVVVKPPGSDSQYTIQFRCIGAKHSAGPTDFNIISMSQLIHTALRERFGGVVRYGGRNEVC